MTARSRPRDPGLVERDEKPPEIPGEASPLRGLDELAQDVLRTTDLPHLGDEHVCELLRRDILR